MSTINSFPLFPELSPLRKLALELQGQFAASKPGLDAKLTEIRSGISKRRIDEFVEFLALPGTSEPNGELLRLHASVSGYVYSLDEYLMQSASASDILEGNTVEEMLEVSGKNLQEVGDLLQRIIKEYADEEETVVPGSERRFILDRTGDLMSILMNAFFEMLDYLPAFAEFPKRLDDILKEYGKNTHYFSGIIGAAPFAEMLANWMHRWEHRKELSERINWWANIATLDLPPPQNIDKYKTGDKVLGISVLRGKIVELATLSGRLPAGMFCHPNGSVMVDAPAKLMAGIFEGIVLKGKTDEGLGFIVPLPELELNVDIEASYEFNSPFVIESCPQNTILASPLDEDDRIEEAQIMEGRYPPGVKFNTRNGVFSVGHPERLSAGLYPMKVVTIDRSGGETVHELLFVFIHEGDPIPEVETFAEATAATNSWPGYVGGNYAVNANYLETAIPAEAVFQQGLSAYQPQVSPIPIRDAEGKIIYVPQFVIPYIPSMMQHNSIVGYLHAGNGTVNFQSVYHGNAPFPLDLEVPGLIRYRGGQILERGEYDFVLKLHTTRQESYLLPVKLLVL
jgi:hypothetical protein